MAAELITPTDELSGIPLPILPQEVLPINRPEIANWHHPWHAESAPELQTLGGKALRHSRVQLVRTTDHNYGDKSKGKLTYHDFYLGPELPTDEDEQFRMCVLAAAGYIPERAIDLRGDEPVKVQMTPEQIEILRRPALPRKPGSGEILRLEKRAMKAYELQIDPTVSPLEYVNNFLLEYRQQLAVQAGYSFRHLVYRYEPIRDFFRERILNQDLRHINELKIEEFLLTKDEERRLHLGRWLLAQAAVKTTDSLQAPYRDLRKTGRLHPLMPADAALLVFCKLGHAEQRTQLVLEHREVLMNSVGLAA